MKVFVFWIFLITTVFSYNSVELVSKDVVITKSGFYTQKKDVSVHKIKELFSQGFFENFTSTAYSDGCVRATYWYGFEVEIKNSLEPIFLDLLDSNMESCKYYLYDANNQLIKESQGGMTTPINKREIATFSSRFLVSNQSNFTGNILLECNSYYSKINSFAIGSAQDLNKMWNLRHGIFLLAFGIFLGLFFYNFIFFISTKKREYFYYLIYNSSLFLLATFFLGYFVFIPYFANNSPFFVALIANTLYIFLIIFTQQFLELKVHFPKLNKIFTILLFALIITTMGFPLGFETSQIVSQIILIVVSIIVLVVAMKLLFQSSVAARFYLIAVGGNIIAQITFFTFLGDLKIIPYSIWSINILTFAVIWDMLFLSLALAYRMEQTEKEKQNLEQLAILKSKYRNFGEMCGSIIHQWRTPLGQLGSLIANLQGKIQYSQVESKEILRVLNSSNEIIQHLSQTITTFQNFFYESKEEKFFSLNKEINNCINFLHPTLKDSRIAINLILDKDVEIKGDSKEFIQILMILFINAKDALEQKETDRCIALSTIVEKNSVSIILQDNGGGFSVKNSEELFHLNYSTKESGMGLGLYIGKIIVEEKLKGNITAKSESSSAIFTIEIPINHMK